MKRKFPLAGTAGWLGMLALILDSRTALESAGAGVDLCLKTVIPSLFPFLAVSGLVGFSGRWLRSLGRICGLPAGAEPLLVPAFLGGYPVGAGSVAQAYRAGQLGKADAERMLGFCNNCGPAFLFGFGSALFPQKWMIWALWGVHIGSALLTARFLPGGTEDARVAPAPRRSVSECLAGAVEVMGLICGWVVLFRVLLGFLDRWAFGFLPSAVRVALAGLLELTNGCCQLSLIENIEMRFLLCSGMLALGGLCVTMQTASVTAGLSLNLYCRGKLMQAAFSLLLSVSILRGGWYPVAVTALTLAAILVQKQKRGSKFAPSVV